jgi:hypothetical protein
MLNNNRFTINFNILITMPPVGRPELINLVGLIYIWSFGFFHKQKSAWGQTLA